MKSSSIFFSLFVILCMLSFTAHAENNGAELFGSHCQMCHGADGKGATPTGKAFNVVDLHSSAVMKMSDADLAAVISNGKNKMPAFSGRLTAPEIENLVSYIRVLQKQ